VTVAAISLWDHPDGFELGSLDDANPLLASAHYLGPTHRARLVVVQYVENAVVAAQVWSLPTTRHLPADGSFLELARWCLTPDSGKNAGSRMHAFAVRAIRSTLPEVTTLVSYSDRAVGHTGSLYRACNWQWKPAWQRVSPPPSGSGSWDGVTRQEPKDRWVFVIRRDPEQRRLELEPLYAARI
jgi:hypothetical protein